MAAAMAEGPLNLDDLREEVIVMREHADNVKGDEPFGGLSVLVLCIRALNHLDMAAGVELSEYHFRGNQMAWHAKELYAAILNPGNNVAVNGFNGHDGNIPDKDLDELTQLINTTIETLDADAHANEGPFYLMEPIRVLCLNTQGSIHRANGVENSIEHRQALKLAAAARLFFERWLEFQQQP